MNIAAVQREAGGFDQLDGRRSRARRQRHVVIDDVPDRRRVHAFDVLERVNRRRERTSVDVRGNRTLEDDAEDVRVVVHREEPELALFLRHRARPGLVFEAQTDALGRTRLAANVNLGLLMVADADGHEPADRLRGRRVFYALRDVVENAIAKCPAVEQPMILHSPDRYAAKSSQICWRICGSTVLLSGFAAAFSDDSTSLTDEQ